MANLVEFKISVPNAAKIHFAFAGLAAEVKDWSKNIWPSVRDRAMRPWLKAQFAQQGHGEHGRWAPLKEPYATRKQKKYPDKPILEATGKMKEGLLTTSGEMTPRTYRIASNVPYSIFHQTGTKKMEARRIFDPEIADAPGSMKRLIRVSVAHGFALHARKLGFAVGGEAGLDQTPEQALVLGKEILSGGFGGIVSTVAEGL